MNEKFLVGFSVLSVAAAAFWACGDGDVITKGGDDELALLNYGPPFAEGDEGNMKTLLNQAMADCAADEACAAKMEGAEYVPPESSAEGGEGGEGGDTPATGSSSSKAGPVINSSTASTTPVGSSASGGNNPPPSSAAAATDLSVPDGTCSAKPESITKGESVTWTFKPAEVSASKYGPTKMQEYLADKANYEKLVNGSNCNWTIEGGTVTSGNISGTCGGDGKTITVTYATPNNYSASIKLGEKTITCSNSVAVAGTPLTGCECSVDNASPDIKDGPVTITWSISGCSEDIGDASWTNATKTSDLKKATATGTEKGQIIAPSVEVQSVEFAKMSVPCPSVKVNNSSDPICEQLDFEIDQWNSNKNIQQKFTTGCYDINTAKACSNAQIQAEGSGTYTTNGESHNCNYYDGKVTANSIFSLEVGEGCTVKQIYLSGCS